MVSETWALELFNDLKVRIIMKKTRKEKNLGLRNIVALRLQCGLGSLEQNEVIFRRAGLFFASISKE